MYLSRCTGGIKLSWVFAAFPSWEPARLSRLIRFGSITQYPLIPFASQNNCKYEERGGTKSAQSGCNFLTGRQSEVLQMFPRTKKYCLSQRGGANLSSGLRLLSGEAMVAPLAERLGIP